MAETDVIAKLVEEAQNSYDYLRLTVVDFHGILRTKIYPKDAFSSVLRNGYGIFSGTIGISIDSNVTAIPSAILAKFPNDVCKPVPDTLHPLPLHGGQEFRIGEVFCVVHKNGESTPRPENPRTILQAQLDKLQNAGFLLKSSFELEYTVVDAETLQVKLSNPTYCLTSRAVDMTDMTYYHTWQTLKKMGVSAGEFSAEAGAGQYEITFVPQIGIKQADNLLLTKETLKYIHGKKGERAITMTKPFKGDFSNGIHFNHSLLDASTKQNAFYDSSSNLRLSATWKYWLGGILKHSPAITAFACPTVNCYRRLHQFGTPTKADWGVDDRLASFRAKNNSESESYIEARMPSGSHNPYLAMAAFVAAGLDGLNNNYDIPEQRGQEKSEPTSLPRSLEEALSALEQDQYMVSAMGEDFVKWFVQIKRAEIQCKAVRDFDPNVDDPAAYELERTLYMDFV